MDDKEVLEIEVDSLNEPLEPDPFSLPGMGLAVPTAVHKFDSNRLFVWDGHEVLDWEAYNVSVKNQAFYRRVFFASVSLLGAIVAGLAVTRLFRGRRGEPID